MTWFLEYKESSCKPSKYIWEGGQRKDVEGPPLITGHLPLRKL